MRTACNFMIGGISTADVTHENEEEAEYDNAKRPRLQDQFIQTMSNFGADVGFLNESSMTMREFTINNTMSQTLNQGGFGKVQSIEQSLQQQQISKSPPSKKHPDIPRIDLPGMVANDSSIGGHLVGIR